MPQIISVLTSYLHQTATTFLLGLTLSISIASGLFGFVLPVQAATLASNSDNAQVEQRGAQLRDTTQQAGKQAEQAGEGLFSNVKEKLNLDEPLPNSTKAFFKQVQGEDVEVEEPRPSGKGEAPKNE